MSFLPSTSVRAALLVIAGLTASCASAPDRAPSRTAAEEPKEDGVVILAQTPQHLEIALMTSRELVASHEASVVRVLACGPAVSALTKDGASARAVAERDPAHVHVLACGISLDRAKIDPASLEAGVEVVPNGLVEVLRLQRRGYRSVEL